MEFVLFILSIYMYSYFVFLCHDVRYDYRVKQMFDSPGLLFLLSGGSCFIYVICVCLRILMSNTIYFHIRWCSCRLAVTRRKALEEQESITLPGYLRPPPVFNGIRFAPYSVFFCVLCCRSMLVLLTFFFSSLYCVSFFDWRLLITTLVSSHFSYSKIMIKPVEFQCKKWRNLTINNALR